MTVMRETDEDASDAVTYYLDSDDDEYGDANTTMDACSAPENYVENSDDCDDSNEHAWSTDAAEVCDTLTTTVMEPAKMVPMLRMKV